MTKQTLRIDVITSSGDVTTLLCGDECLWDVVSVRDGTLSIVQYDENGIEKQVSGWAPGCWFKFAARWIDVQEKERDPLLQAQDPENYPSQ